MNMIGALLVFVLSWWMVFLAVISRGVVTPADQAGRGEAPGHSFDAAAPLQPHIGRKVLIASAGAACITASVWLMEAIGVFALAMRLAAF